MSIDARSATTEGPCLDCGSTEGPMIDEYLRMHDRQGDWFSKIYRWSGPVCQNRPRCWARVEEQARKEENAP